MTDAQEPIFYSIYGARHLTNTSQQLEVQKYGLIASESYNWIPEKC
jgi:hypothetical protein